MKQINLITPVNSDNEHDDIYYCYAEIHPEVFFPALEKMQESFNLIKERHPLYGGCSSYLSGMKFGSPAGIDIFWLNLDIANELGLGNGVTFLAEAISEEVINDCKPEFEVDEDYIRFVSDAEDFFITALYEYENGGVHSTLISIKDLKERFVSIDTN
jgi:hypothetical protein